MPVDDCALHVEMAVEGDTCMLAPDLRIIGAKGKRLRQGEKAVALCRKAWKVVRRLYPDEFDDKTPNPWEGVTRERRVKKKETSGNARTGLCVCSGLH